MTDPDQKVLGVRLEKQIMIAIDNKRMALGQQTGVIPTRSDIVRNALLAYLDEKSQSPKKNKD
jgi:hypothetical protein